MYSAAVVLSLVASAYAVTVTSPVNGTIWTGSGSQTVSWTTVSTDPSNFTIALVTNGDSNNAQVLKAYELASDGNTTVNPPSGGWPTGKDFQINLVQDDSHLSTIYAQSGQFTITTSSSSSSVSGSSSATTITGTSVTGTSQTTPVVGTSAGASGSAASSDATSSSTASTTSNNGASSITMGASGLFAGLALLGAVMA